MKPFSILQLPSFQLALAISSLGISAAAEATYQFYRFVPVSPRNGGSEIQLSEFDFYLNGNQLPTDGVAVTNPGGSKDLNNSEGALKLLDGDTATKWFDGNFQPLIFDFGIATTIDGYRFTTANDVAGRDPVTWRLEGGNDGSEWTVIDIVNDNDTVASRFADSQIFTLPELIAPQVTTFTASFADGTLAGVVLNGTSVELEWDAIFSEETILAGPPKVVAEQGTEMVTPAADADTTYTLTANNTGGSDTASVTVRSVVGGEAKLQYLRFTPLQTQELTAGAIQLTEMFFVNGGAIVTPISVTSEGGQSPSHEAAPNVIDKNNSTKWYDPAIKPLLFDFGSEVTIDSYGFVTGNDFPGRDPARWMLEASEDQVTWTIIDRINSFHYPMPTERFATTQDIPLPGASLTIPEVQSFRIVSFSTAKEDLQITLSWTSEAGEYYTIAQSQDLNEWPNVLGSNIPGAADATETSITLDYDPDNGTFFRVEKQAF